MVWFRGICAFILLSPSQLLPGTLSTFSRWRCVTWVLLFSLPSHFHSLAASQDKKMKCQGQEEPCLVPFSFYFYFHSSPSPHENAIFLWECPPGMTRIAGHGVDLPLELMGCQKGRFCAQPSESPVDSIAIVWTGIVTFRQWKRIGEHERDSLFCCLQSDSNRVGSTRKEYLQVSP